MWEPLLNESETKENKEHRSELLRLIASAESVAFVGAGLSRRVGYPGWIDLVTNLEEFAGNFGRFEPPPGLSRKQDPEYVQAIKEHIVANGDLKQYWNYLGREFGPRTPPYSRVQCDLMSLPFRGVITSNYDPSLEYASCAIAPGWFPLSISVQSNKAHLISQFLFELNQKGAPRPIAHLHGEWRDPSSIVLTAEDYKDAYGLRIEGTAGPSVTSSAWTLHRKLLWALLATRRFVFFGFSMDDIDFSVMLRSVTDDLWNWQRPIHYALISIDRNDPEATKGKALDLWRRHGVRVVFYEDLDGSHAGLDRFVSDAIAMCKTEDEGGYLEALSRRTDRAMGYED
jgi:hypothetical protein